MPLTPRSRSWRRTIRVESADDPRYYRYPSFFAATMSVMQLPGFEGFRKVLGIPEPEPERPAPSCPIRRRARAKEAAG